MDITKYSFYTALNHLNDFMGISMNPEDFENIAFHAWYKIGNKRFRLYVYTEKITDGKIDLPCNVDEIEFVGMPQEDFYMPNNTIREDYSNLTVESYIEGRKRYQNRFYQFGKAMPYEQVDNTLYFKTDSVFVNVLYKGYLSDEQGLPYINGKEVEAIAKYCAYIYNTKKGMATRDQFLMQAAQMNKLDWERACANARVPEKVNQNEMDEILNVDLNWDRKRFGQTFKPIRV